MEQVDIRSLFGKLIQYSLVGRVIYIDPSVLKYLCPIGGSLKSKRWIRAVVSSKYELIQSYTAAARLMTTLDEALDTLINRTGVVGR